VVTLRQFLWEGTPWRSLTASAGKVSGLTLRRHLEQWADIGVLAQVHAVLVGMLRGDPILILDTCSVRAKRNGDLIDPTDPGKRGTQYHIATMGDDAPVACAGTAANVNDTLVFERLFLAAFAVMARIQTVFADKGTCCPGPRHCCARLASAACPNLINAAGRACGCRVRRRTSGRDRDDARHRSLALRYDRLGSIIQSLLQAACIFLVVGRVEGIVKTAS